MGKAGALMATRLWLERVVIGLSLCPWARPVHEDRGGVRFAHTASTKTEGLCVDLLREIELLGQTEATETTILVCPEAFVDDFVEFNMFVADAEELLCELDLDDQYQLVAFHPQFRFAGEPEDDAGNWVNRSPHPAVHILTQASVTMAIDRQPTLAGQTPEVNRRLLEKIGADEMRRRVEATRNDAAP